MKGEVKGAQRDAFEDFKGHMSTLIEMVTQNEKSVTTEQQAFRSKQGMSLFL